MPSKKAIKYTTLSDAVMHRDVREVSRLIDAAADGEVLREGMLLACQVGAIKIVRAFLDANVPVNPLSTKGTGSTPLLRAIDLGNHQVVEMLLQAGADPNYVPPDAPSALRPVMRSNSDASFVATLVRAGADINARSGTGDTALIVAARSRDASRARLLLSLGADPNVRNRDGHTALSEAWVPEDKELIKVLLNHGADVRLAGYHGHALYEYFFIEGDQAAMRRLAALGAPKDVQPHVRFAVAVSKHDWTIAEQLRRQGADPDRLLPDTETCMLRAVSKGDVEAVEKLLLWGAKTDVVDVVGFTPLCMAAHLGHIEIVKLLAEHGANLLYCNERFMPSEPDRPSVANALFFAREPVPWMDATQWERKKQVATYLQAISRRNRRDAGIGRTGVVAATPATARYVSSRGVATFEGHRQLVLLHGPLDKAMKRMGKLLGVERWKKDVWGINVRVAGRCFAAWQYGGHEWTTIWPFGDESEEDLQDLADQVSAAANSRVILFRFDDDPGDLQYSLYESGKLRERFRYTDTGTVDVLLKRAKRLSKPQQEELRSLKTGNGMLLKSKEHELPARERVFEFVDQLVREQGAYVPPLQWVSGGARNMTLSPTGIEPQDIVRLDWISDG